tara:strand:+ start:361 stop:702 length:342 start_codon:yes stop_codon:yes gene_type:complete
MKRLVNGVEVDLSPEEEAEVLAERAAELAEIGKVKLVSMAQARKALIQSSISIASVDAALAGITDPMERELAQTDWEYASDVRRESDLVNNIANAFELSENEVDDLFTLAAGL